jgi:hypothetical protein
MNFLLIHGVNTNEDAVPDPYLAWANAITAGLTSAGYQGAVAPSETRYNDIFDKHSANILLYGAAVAELLASAAWYSVVGPTPAGIARPLGAPEQPDSDFLSQMRWSAGMVAQWVVEDNLRADCRDRLAQLIQQTNPDVICAHSLGTLLCYDLLLNDPRGQTIFNQGTLVTFGSQIGNPFVKDRMWKGQVSPIKVKMWYNLYNPNDPVLVAPIDLEADNFHQFTTAFGNGYLDESGHNPTKNDDHPGYLDNPTTNANIWPALGNVGMASLIARNIKISNSSLTSMANLALPGQPAPKRKSKHHYHYHPPRADHPLLKSAPVSRKLGLVPPAVDLRPLCLPIRAQGAEQACSGFATAAFREASHAAAAGSPLSGYLSPAYLYARTRMNDHTFPADSGASIADEFSVLQNYGVCPETVMPYRGNPNDAPSPIADTAAAPYRIIQPAIVYRDPVSIKSALTEKQTVTIGFTVYESFEQDSRGVLTLPDPAKEKVLGGHGVLVCGYDDARSWWIVRNQWGTAFGDNGYYYMPYGYEAFWTEAWTAVPTA